MGLYPLGGRPRYVSGISIKTLKQKSDLRRLTFN
jgi:hypothetical protein